MQLDPALPIGPQLHAILRERLIRNELPPGSQMSETEVARQFLVSRQPVREVFIKLAAEGLIEIRPQRATIVRKIDREAVLDARFVREAVEADIVRMLAESPDRNLIVDLRRQLEDQRAIDAGSPDVFIRADEKFHATLAQGAGKAAVWEIISGLKSQMDRVRYLSFALFPQDNLVRQHTLVVDRIEQGDVSGAEAAIRRHLREVLRDLPEIMRAHPEVFKTPIPEEAHTENQPRRTP